MELKELVKKNKKIDPREYEEEPFEKRSYLSSMKLTDVRMRMRISCGMISQIKANFKQKYKRKNMSILCSSCRNLSDNEITDDDDETKEKTDTQLHLLEECKAFSELRSETDLNTDEGLVYYFNQVIKKRLEEDEELPYFENQHN